MIDTFADKDTKALFETRRTRRFANIARPALRKLLMIHAATNLEDLRVPPANHLEALKGDLAGYHSIRINKQWRVIFLWHEEGAKDVQIVDYH